MKVGVRKSVIVILASIYLLDPNVVSAQVQTEAQLKEKQDKVVAEGEVTGHAHILDNGALYESLNSDSILFIKSDQKTRIVHDEHLPIKLEPGNYEVIRQREYLGPGLQKRIVRD